jgi:hypothetical protein
MTCPSRATVPAGDRAVQPDVSTRSSQAPARPRIVCRELSPSGLAAETILDENLDVQALRFAV